jgi:hypothetical protein
MNERGVVAASIASISILQQQHSRCRQMVVQSDVSEFKKDHQLSRLRDL